VRFEFSADGDTQDENKTANWTWVIRKVKNIGKRAVTVFAVR
jgi:hypothetical protein